MAERYASGGYVKLGRPYIVGEAGRDCHSAKAATPRLRGRAAVAQRLRRLRAEPLCRDCTEQGRVTAATVPDHITPLAKGGSDDDANIRCLCGPCHEKRTAEQFGHRKLRARIGADGWPIE